MEKRCKNCSNNLLATAATTTDRQTQTLLEQRRVHVDMCDCDCDCWLSNALTQLNAVDVAVVIVVVDVTLYESICYNANMSLAR